MENPSETLGHNLKVLREQYGFTQSNIANFLKVDQSLICMAEKGKRALTSDMLEKLASLYGVQSTALHKANIEKKPLSIALRASEISREDLETIGVINRIALKCSIMTDLLEGDQNDA